MLLEVRAQLLDIARPAGITARHRQASAQIPRGGRFEAADVIPLPAGNTDRDRREPRERRLGIHAKLDVALSG